MPIVTPALALSLLALSPTVSPNRAAESKVDEIVVTALSKPLTLNSKELTRAVKAYHKLRAVYAPQSQLLFQIVGAAGSDRRVLEDLKLTLRSKEGSVPVPIDADRRFTLPTSVGKGWTLIANRRVGFGILPVVLSPGTGTSDRLLGDLRLQCEVQWAMAKPDLSIVMRATASAFGGFCKGSVLPFFEWSDRAIASASVSAGALIRPVYVTEDRMAYRAPVHDKNLPHSARVRVRYR